MNIKRTYRYLTALLAVVLLLPLLALGAGAESKPSQAGEKVLSGGQRDFLWPVPGNYGLSGCFLDNRRHYALDIPADGGTPVTASYKGTVIETYAGCTHNYGKTHTCCNDGFGNYVALQHNYTLKDGSHITLYSRYSHLTDVTVTVGQTVNAGQQVGTIGSTGYSTGDHLDFQILYGDWKPYRTYSIDPYINELLEMPEGFYCASTPSCCGVGPTACCCAQYVKYVKALYPSCTHSSFSAEGHCTGCGHYPDWSSTKDGSVLGIYTAKADTSAAATPYAAAQLSPVCTIAAGEEVQVAAVVTNGAYQRWYLLATSGAYVPVESLQFSAYLASDFSCTMELPTEGQTLLQQSYSLKGTLSSRYPLRKVSGYIDGTLYGSWTNSGASASVNLGNTAINAKLQFSSLAPGVHTLTITATDSTGREESTVLTRTFTIAAATVKRVTFDPMGGICSMTFVEVEKGTTAGNLPVPELYGYHFTGWYTKDGITITKDTVIFEDITVQAGWEPVTFTITFDGTQVLVPYLQAISFPEVQKEGHTLLGWYSDDGTEIHANTPVTGDLVLHPRWEACQYRITLDTNGGGHVGRYRAVAYGAAYGQLPAPQRAGYSFTGWLLNGTPITAETVVSLAEDHTLTAGWEPIATEPNITQPATEPTPRTAKNDASPAPYVAGGMIALSCSLIAGVATMRLRRKKKAPAEAE